MDLFSIPIMVKHACDSMGCITQTDYVTITDLSLFGIVMNGLYGYLAIYFYLDYRKRKKQSLEKVE